MSCEEIFNSWCPYYLSIGMTWNQYWYGDVTMVRAFYEADKLKQQRENRNAWMNGLYVYQAIARLAPILRSFEKNGTQAEDYLKEPYPLFRKEKEEKAKEEEERIAQNESLRAELYFRNWANAVANKMKNNK